MASLLHQQYWCSHVYESRISWAMSDGVDDGDGDGRGWGGGGREDIYRSWGSEDDLLCVRKGVVRKVISLNGKRGYTIPIVFYNYRFCKPWDSDWQSDNGFPDWYSTPLASLMPPTAPLTLHPGYGIPLVHPPPPLPFQFLCFVLKRKWNLCRFLRARETD